MGEPVSTFILLFFLFFFSGLSFSVPFGSSFGGALPFGSSFGSGVPFSSGFGSSSSSFGGGAPTFGSSWSCAPFPFCVSYKPCDLKTYYDPSGDSSIWKPPSSETPYHGVFGSPPDCFRRVCYFPSEKEKLVHWSAVTLFKRQGGHDHKFTVPVPCFDSNVVPVVERCSSEMVDFLYMERFHWKKLFRKEEEKNDEKQRRKVWNEVWCHKYSYDDVCDDEIHGCWKKNDCLMYEKMIVYIDMLVEYVEAISQKFLEVLKSEVVRVTAEENLSRTDADEKKDVDAMGLESYRSEAYFFEKEMRFDFLGKGMVDEEYEDEFIDYDKMDMNQFSEWLKDSKNKLNKATTWHYFTMYGFFHSIADHDKVCFSLFYFYSKYLLLANQRDCDLWLLRQICSSWLP